MFREHEKRFLNDDSLLKNTSIWKEKKDDGSPTLCTFKDLSCSYGNLDLAASNSRNTRKFFLILLRPDLSIPDILYHQFSAFPFQTSFSIFTYPTPPPNIQQLNIAWLMMRSTLHVSLNRKTFCITTMGDGRRGREKRGILKCSVVFNASKKEKKTLKIILFYETKTWKRKFLTKLLGSREINQKNCKNCTKLRKMSKLFQIRSPFISYCKEEPAQETRTSC